MKANTVSLGEGWTPLVDISFDGLPVTLKMDYLCPTGSFKDRGTTVMVSKLKEWGISEIIADSSGNGGASVAAYASACGIVANILIPANTSKAKEAQIRMYGANLIRVAGTREDCAKSALEASKHTFYCSHSWSPYFLAGMKTTAYEIAEQLLWKAPDWIVMPVGGGSLLHGLYLGFRDLLEHRIIGTLPRMVAVQSIHFAPIFHAWSSNVEPTLSNGAQETAAEGIAISNPVRARGALEAIRGSNGVACAVTDGAIWDSLSALARHGVYAEPTSSAALAGLRKLRQDRIVKNEESVVVVVTGSCLKATDKIISHYW